MLEMENPTAEIQLARDKKLVRTILSGDERAFDSFVNEYFPKLYRYAKHRLNNDTDVEEVVQTTLTNAARSLPGYRGEATLLTWLIQICRHEISKQLGKISRHTDLMSPFLNDEVLRCVVESIEINPADDPEAAYQRQELITTIQFALDQLPERYAAVLELKYIAGYSLKEIAEQLGSTMEATQSVLARARRAFRELFGEAFQHLGIDDDQPQHRLPQPMRYKP